MREQKKTGTISLTKTQGPLKKMQIRPEKPEDKSKIATLIANTYLPDGAKIIEKLGVLRGMESYSVDLSVVQESESGIDAFALLTPIAVGSGKGVYLAPLAFDMDSKSFDLSAFIDASNEKAKAQGFRYVFVQGSGEDLKPFGFEYAAEKGFVHHAGNMMVKDLIDGEGLSGEVKLPEVLEK